MSRKLVPSTLALALVTTLALAQPAHAAYVDPGSGSYLIQVAIAGVIGAAFSLKLFWAKIKLAISERLGGAKSGPEADDRG